MHNGSKYVIGVCLKTTDNYRLAEIVIMAGYGFLVLLHSLF